MPEVESGMYLIDVLFKIGPIRGEMPLVESDLEPWERRRHISLTPWQAELILDMSKAYMSEMYSAKSVSAIAPWPKARKMWKYVMDKKHEKQKAEQPKEPHGSHKRHRNPPTG